MRGASPPKLIFPTRDPFCAVRTRWGGSSGDYPIIKEEQLVAAIRSGAQHTARSLLNEILGFVMFSTGGDLQEMCARATELLVVVSRAAISGGAEAAPVLALNRRAMQDIKRSRTPDDLTFLLADLTERYVELVFNTHTFKHQKALDQALEYIYGHYMERLNIQTVAAQIGMSPNYFSHIFKEEVGSTFRQYLNLVRVERSRLMLLSDELSVLQICNMCGYEDQSYFVKVFKKYTGTTPTRFREQHSRIRYEKERSKEE